MPYISQSFIDDLPNQIDIVELINKRLPLKKMGSDYRAPCPFHGGKNRNFSVSPSKQFYHCFKCGESGGAISFVQKFDHLGFVETIETIASEFGLSVVYEQNTKPVDPRLQRYRDLLQAVSVFYVTQLKRSVAKEKAVGYAKARGISGATAKRFELGFATPGNHDLLQHFKENAQTVADLKALGLVKTGQYGDYDFFRDRLMFPIHNSKGGVIGFGGRAFDGNVKAKYLNSSESPVFSKSRELYGLYQARKYSPSMDYVLVVEGYMDVLALHQAGITQSVATLGTATTAQHLQSLARTSHTIVFCFDGDEAGRAAAWKALKAALPVIKAGLQIKFLFLPDGEDPDSFVQKNSKKAFKQLIEQAWPLSQFLFQHVKEAVAFDTIEGKTAFVEQVLDLLLLVEYDTYQQQLIEGVALEVNQQVSQVMKVFDAKQASAQQQAVLHSAVDDNLPHFMDNMPLPVDDDMLLADVVPSVPVATNTAPSGGANVLMSRMISLLLNYPVLADATVEVRVRHIEQSEVLLELVHAAQMDEQITAEALIAPFASKPKIYQRLQALSVLEPWLSEQQAKAEFLFALDAAEKRQVDIHIKTLIAKDDLTEAEQQQIYFSLQKRKPPE